MFNPEVFEDMAGSMVTTIMLAQEAGNVSEAQSSQVLGMSVIDYRKAKEDRLLNAERLVCSHRIFVLWQWCTQRFEQGAATITVSEIQRAKNARYRTCQAVRQDLEKLVQFNLVKWQSDRKTAILSKMRLIDIPIKKELETAGER
jgi:hypothetical protein